MASRRAINFPVIPPVPAVQQGRVMWRDELHLADGHRGAWPDQIDPADGSRQVLTRDAFEAYARRDDVPGALGVREVKFMIVDVDTANPRLYFINSNRHDLHYRFTYEVLGARLDISTFNRVTYFSETRSFVAGSVLAHDTYTGPSGQVGLYSIVFWPSDIVRFPRVQMTYRMLAEAMPFTQHKLAYQPGGLGQQELAQREAGQFEAAGVPVVTTDALFSGVRYAPMNLGAAVGRLVVVDEDSRPPTARDIPIFKQLPNDLARVAAVITEAPQTPLAHVNVRAQQNGIPNAYLRGASTDEVLAPFVGKIVGLTVGVDTIDVREATEAELQDYMDLLRPDEVQIPAADLDVSDIASLDDLRHEDFNAYGAKAANVAELRRILEQHQVPAGYAVPFSFYDRFMRYNGFDVYVADVIADMGLLSDEEVRREALKDLRKVIRAGQMPDDLRAQLGEMHAAFPDGTTPRCRSSANAEDLQGFSGAGLYNSYTHRADEGHIEKSIKQVWASLWTFRAFEERAFHRVDHLACAMGVLVHPNFDDEQANGVAITHNPYFANFAGYYVNVQLGEDRVTNPVEDAVAEEFLVMSNAGLETLQDHVTIRIRESNLAVDGQAVLSVQHVQELVDIMAVIQPYFQRVYRAIGDDQFAMEIEFKVDQSGVLVVKQARPWRI